MDKENVVTASPSGTLATWSWRLFLAGMLALAVLSLAELSVSTNLTVLAVIFTVHLGGALMAIVALFGVSKHGRKGVLIPAVVGLTLNMAIVVLAIGVLLTLLAVFRAQYG